ncbi:MAG: SDR family NAD(P)-dependent oxidoreductase [Chloroflexi bacterium]|nr:SDR family NAD(P)-dependent oxidoreductase [Chloroflexota bacterium]
MFDFTDRIVMVTGGSGSLGGVVVNAFAAAGARLIIPDRAADRVQSLFPELAASQEHCLIPAADVTHPEGAEQVVSESMAHYGRIDILVNALGGYKAGTPTHETSLDIWDSMMGLNARALFVVCRAVIPTMLTQQHGHIVNVAARAGLAGGANMSAYSASKSAVIRLTETMAAEYRDAGITVNAVLPGLIDTPKAREEQPNADYSRWVTPEALAQIIMFLVSDAGKSITGASIPA